MKIPAPTLLRSPKSNFQVSDTMHPRLYDRPLHDIIAADAAAGGRPLNPTDAITTARAPATPEGMINVIIPSGVAQKSRHLSHRSG